MRYRLFLLLAAVCAHGAGCGENKRAARVEADVRPVRVATGPEELLEDGAVERIQQALRAAGFVAAWSKGELDRPTSQAIASFQAKQGLPATGVPDRKTVVLLGLARDEVFKSISD